MYYKHNLSILYPQKMQKSQISTSSDPSTLARQNSQNEAHLMQLVKNLELELGYHAIALKKAQKMIKLLQNDNGQLKNENQILRARCKELEFKCVKYENQLSAISRSSGGREYGECFSAGLQKSDYLQPYGNDSMDRNIANSTRSISKRLQKYAKQTETPIRKTVKNITKPNRLTQPQAPNYKQNQPTRKSPLHKRRSQNHQRSPIRPNTQSYSFIPFEELEFKSNWQ